MKTKTKNTPAEGGNLKPPKADAEADAVYKEYLAKEGGEA